MLINLRFHPASQKKAVQEKIVKKELRKSRFLNNLEMSTNVINLHPHERKDGTLVNNSLEKVEITTTFSFMIS